MNLGKSWPLALLLMLTPLEAASAEGQPVGMIVQSEGQIIIERSGSRRPALLADVLLAGDTLSAISGEAQFLFCPQPSKVSLGQGTRLKLTEQGIEVAQGSGPQSQTIARCSVPKVALNADSQERIGGVKVRKAGVPELALYLGGPVSSTHPVFSWEAQPDADGYRLTVRRQHGGEIWTTALNENRAELPAQQPALKPGVYEWEVEALQQGRTIAQAETRFEIRPAGRGLAFPQAAEPSEVLLAAVEYENEGYYAEAAQLYARLDSTGMPDDSLNKRLVWLYQQAGLTKAAEKVLGR